MKCKDQSISSFEDAMVGLRPHMSARVLGIWLMAWEPSSHSCSYALGYARSSRQRSARSPALMA